MDVLKKDRGEARQILLDTFAAGLSAEDEAFLEIAYNDKSEPVQRIARSLLVRIPTSALSRSILALIDPLISYSHEKSTSSKKMMLTVDVPTTISPEWERLGLGKEPAFSQMSD